MKIFTAAIILTALATPLAAQWVNYPTPGIPRTAGGKRQLPVLGPDQELVLVVGDDGLDEAVELGATACGRPLDLAGEAFDAARLDGPHEGAARGAVLEHELASRTALEEGRARLVRDRNGPQRLHGRLRRHAC